MGEHVHSLGLNLNSCIDKNQFAEAERIIDEINKVFQGELSLPVIDTLLSYLFKDSTGILAFLNKVLYKSEYKKSKITCYEFLYTLVNNFTDKLKNYFFGIINTCSPVVRSSASAIEKDKSLKLITLIIDKGNLYSNNEVDTNAEISNLYENTLLRCLRERHDSNITVHRGLLFTIGAVAKRYPSAIVNPQALQKTLINQINKELSKPNSNRSYPVINGAFSALSSYLENYPLNEENCEASNILYKCIKLLVDPGDDNQRTAKRESLAFISKHIGLIKNALYLEAKWWHLMLLKWIHLGNTDKKAVYKTLEVFYHEIANQLTHKTHSSDKELFDYFMEYFMLTISKASVDNYEMNLAIFGLGSFAESFGNHITAKEINKIFTTISQFMENTYILNEGDINSEQIMYLPHYVQTLSFIMKSLPQLNPTHVTSLLRVCILMIKIFPKILPVQHYLVVDAFILALFQLLKCKNNILEDFLEDVIYHGVLWTCSHQIAIEAEVYRDQKEIITYKSYLQFWRNLLRITRYEKFESYEITVRIRRVIVQKVFNQLIKTLFFLIHRLNLNTKLKDNKLPITNPAVAYEAVQSNDFVIFVNIVDFYQDILETVEQEMFRDWIRTFINQIVIKSIKHPLVSGFYKLLAACMKVCDNLKYFDNSTNADDISSSFQSVHKFLEEVLLKMKQYKGDLQLACMHLILAAPVSVVINLLHCAAPAFISLFDVGRSYLSIASLGIDTLERWLKYMPRTDIEPFLKQVLPSLDSYLRSRSLGGNLVTSTPIKIRKTKQALNKRKILTQTEPELYKLQHRILTFLGQLNDDLCLTVVSSEDYIEPVVWNKKLHLKVTLPYSNVKINLYLDKLVPRIIELALYSSDRKIRVTACELLHAITMILLGTASSLHRNLSKLQELDGLTRVVAEAVLKLGCDTDEVIEQLYAPLAFQLMHYYSHPMQMVLSHTQIIIETLREAVTNPTDAALRDFSGNCIKEFVKWTIKQTDQDDLLKNPINIKLWITTISSFSVHSDPFKRLGAAVIFNKIYAILREETHMFNMFWFEIFHAFVNNLSLTQTNVITSDGYQDVEQVIQALSHIQRGLVEKSQDFNQIDGIRRKPHDFKGNTLKDAALWLFQKTGSINPYCRQKCMSMFCAIIPLVDEYKGDIEKFKERFIDDKPEMVLQIYECGLLKYPTLNSVTTLKGLFDWMQSLLCALDGYIFMIKNRFFPTRLLEKTNFFKALESFMQFVQSQGIAEILNLMPSNEYRAYYTAKDKDQFNNLKSKIAENIIAFTSAILETKTDITGIVKTPELFWNVHLWDLLCYRIFDHSVLGFDFTDLKEDDYILSNLLKYLHSQCSQEISNSFLTHISAYLIKKIVNTSDISINVVSLKQRHILKGLLLIQQSAFADNLNIKKYFIGTIKFLLSHLTESKQDIKTVVKLHRSAQLYWELRLQIALKYKEEFCEMVYFLNNETKVHNEEQDGYREYGSYFFETFKDVIMKEYIRSYSLFSIYNLEMTSNILKIINEMLSYIKHHFRTIQMNNQDLFFSFLKCWNKIISFVSDHKMYVLAVEFINKLIAVSTEPFYIVIESQPSLKEWVISLLTYEEKNWTLESSLNFKSEIFYILSHILGSNDGVEVGQLRNSLEVLKGQYVNQSPVLRIAFLTTFKKILLAVRISRNIVLLNTAVDIYAKASYTTADVNLTTSLTHFIRHVNADMQLLSLNCIYEMAFDYSKYSCMQIYAIANNVFPSIIQDCDYNTFENFYIYKIKGMIALISESNTKVFNTCHIMKKITVYILIELMFLRIKTEKFVDGTCPITKSAFDVDETTDKRLVKTIFKNASLVCKEVYPLSKQEERNIFRLYQCHSINALISLISNTQEQINYYNWLFNREENKQDILWKNVIDTNRVYSFDIDFDSIPSMKKVLVNIRTNLYAARKKQGVNIETIKYIESQPLFNSTLSEDITQFDFSSSIVRDKIERSNKESTNVRQEIELESIDINEHECMASVCGFILHIFNNIDSDINVEVLPQWMKGIRNIMMSDSSHKNIRVFFGKVIHNTNLVFKPYAKWFLAPIIKLIVDGCIGMKINFFITDLVVMLASWSEIAIPTEDPELASKLLEFLMENANNDQRAIFKYNLENIKLIIEVWKPCLTIPHKLLERKIKLDDITNRNLDVGLHLVAAVLANNLSPWKEEQLQSFLKSLTKVMKSPHRNVYQPCAEVLGMSLNYMSLDSKSVQFLKSFQHFIDKNFADVIENDSNKFAYCLQSIALHYPNIIDKYLPGIVAKLMHVGNLKSVYLKIILSRIETLHNLNELCSINFSTLMAEENLETLILSLELIKRCIPYFDHSHLLSVLKSMMNLTFNSSSMCRSTCYDIFITSYHTFCNQKSSTSQEITALCKDVLLQGLIDKEVEIQEKVFNLWLEGSLPIDIKDRFLHLLGSMYKPNIEEQYVGCSVYCLLHSIKSTPEFNEKLFEDALHDCEFEDYILNCNWRRQHVSMAPLFANTLSSQESSFSTMKLNVLRATASSLEFQPTLSLQAGALQRNTQNLMSSSSLLFSVGSKNVDAAPDEEFKDPNSVVPKIQTIRGKRFLKDKSKISRYYAYEEVKKSIKAEELRKERVKQSHSKVTVYRKYRIGDFPDIEITLSSVITPLQMLAKDDVVLSRHLYVVLFESYIQQIDNRKTFFTQVNKSISDILTTSTQFIPNVIGTFLDIALTYKNEIKLDANTITTACEYSGLLSIGSLLLEEYLLVGDTDYETPVKKEKGIVTENVLQWIKLAKLHKIMEEWDVVSAIFLEKMNCNENTVKAIDAECSGNWRSAQEFYANAIEEDDCDIRKDFYYESYFKCFAALGEWKKLSPVIEETISTSTTSNAWTSLWNDDWNQQNVLPWYIKAELRNILNNETEDQKLFSYINEVLTDKEKSEYLKLNFGEELAMLWLVQNDYSSANYYLNNSITNFLENWSHLNPLFVKLRSNRLLNLRNIIDIQLFLKVLDKPELLNQDNFLKSLLNSWQEDSNNFSESLFLIETRTIYRNQFVRTLETKFSSFVSDEISNFSDKLNDCKFKLNMNLIETAISQGNYYIARMYIKQISNYKKNNDIEKAQWFLTLGKILYLKSQNLKGSEQLTDLVNSWSQISKWLIGDVYLLKDLYFLYLIGKIPETSVIGDESMCYLVKTAKHIYNLTQDIYKVISHDEILLNNTLKQQLQQLMGGRLLHNTESIWHFGMTSLQKSVDVCENEIQMMMNKNNLKIYDHLADAYVELAYCAQDKEEFEEEFIVNVLRAMKLGSVDGKQLFPSLLNKDIGCKFRDTFLKEISEMPKWMFLGWLPQLLANLGTSCIFATSDILIEIAKKYPQAMVYAYRLSKEKVSFASEEIRAHGEKVMEKLDDLLLNNDLINKFLIAMSYVTPPRNMLLYYLDRLRRVKVCDSKTEIEIILKELFDQIYENISKYKESDSMQGQIFKKHIGKFEAELKHLIKGKFVANKFAQTVQTLYNNVFTLNSSMSLNLVDYSPWLKNFQSINTYNDLEIPGQYSGMSRPLPQNHIKILGFSTNVLPMSSLRSPLRLTILGHDAKEYHYLVKYGEDLRQDSRIEQLFNLMNHIFASDAKCHKRQLLIVTYQVIPLSSSLGMIEWINNTRELKKFIGDGIENELEKVKYNKELAITYNKWLEKALPRTEKDINLAYYHALSKYKHDDVICKYTSLVNGVDIDVLRKSYYSISSNAESFYALRQKFITSYAVMCASQWLLGIGDRHLGNTLISLRNGQPIGIDFGHAFGTATQILHIPELVPFRLTPHIVHFLKPLGEKGLFQEIMIHCLRAFRKNSNILLSTMNVFIQEPSVDWLKFASRVNMNSDVKVEEWYPKEKIKHARLKLEGVNPINIMIEELKGGNGHTKLIDIYSSLVRGMPGINYRSTKEDFLTEEQQVKCLLDHSTDYNLLGRMYVGWESWI